MCALTMDPFIEEVNYEDGSVICICCWLLRAKSLSGPSPFELATIFYCFRLETFLFVASYDSQGHGGGIRPRFHTGYSLPIFHSLRTEYLIRHGPHRKHRMQQFYYCMCIRCRANVFTEALPSNNHIFWVLLEGGGTDSQVISKASFDFISFSN
jgi:hypothetical protein